MRRWWALVALGMVLAFGAGGLAGLLARGPQPISQAVASTPGAATPIAQVAPNGVLVIHGTGDVNLDPRQVPGRLEVWNGVRDVFRSDALTVVNLECSPGEGGAAEEKRFVFRCDSGAYGAMRDAGVEVANLGNNHAGDYGTDALMDGLPRLRGAGIAPVGAGRNATEANAPATFTIGGRKIAVLGFGGVVPTPAWFAADDRPGVSDGYSTPSMVAAVRRAAADADLVIVTIHWGAELDTEPRDDDVERAGALVDAGADVIFGHHAHRLQPLRFVAGKPVFFGLGNFVWPDRGGPGSTTAIGEVVVAPDGSISACLVPGRIRPSGPVLDRPYAGPCLH